MKDTRKDDERYRLLKHGLKSNSEITDKNQRIVESIFGNIKLMKTLYYMKSIPHLMNQINFYKEEIKSKAKYSSKLQVYQKVYVPVNGNCLF